MSEKSLKISGKTVELKESSRQWKSEPRPGGWIILTSSQGDRKRISAVKIKNRLSAQFAQGGNTFFAEIQTSERGSQSVKLGDQDLIAQFPGKVRKVLVQPGQSVKEGDPLLLIEAMKMEFSIKAPTDGKISKILVKEGQQLSPGDRFLDMVVK
jgi:biotin carboxyl carrier protein